MCTHAELVIQPKAYHCYGCIFSAWLGDAPKAARHSCAGPPLSLRPQDTSHGSPQAPPPTRLALRPSQQLLVSPLGHVGAAAPLGLGVNPLWAGGGGDEEGELFPMEGMEGECFPMAEEAWLAAADLTKEEAVHIVGSSSGAGVATDSGGEADVAAVAALPGAVPGTTAHEPITPGRVAKQPAAHKNAPPSSTRAQQRLRFDPALTGEWWLPQIYRRRGSPGSGCYSH